MKVIGSVGGEICDKRWSNGGYFIQISYVKYLVNNDRYNKVVHKNLYRELYVQKF